ncbi:MAG: peptidoglycan D,D-transpeptidase FtsI family protein [Bdellovibrio bacteriovorus]
MTDTNPLQLFGALVDSPAWPALRTLLHLGFFVTALLVLRGVLQLAFGRGPVPGRARRPGPLAPSLPLIILALLFSAVLVHQASWQLTGLFRPQFVAFMQSHDRRELNPAHRIQRGRIIDRHGEVLAYSTEHQGQVYRVYPFGSAFAHAVGYSHPRYGTTGVEAAANARLNGGAPEQLASWGELGRQLITRDKRPRGQDLALTLDARLQGIALQGLGTRHGAVVMLRPQDGAVLVLASSPAFDPNQVGPALFRSPPADNPLLNRATQGLYPPGSVFKTVLAALAIESGFTGTIDCPPAGYTTSRHYPPIRDHGFYSAREAGRAWGGHGRLDLTSAFAESSNVFFAQLGVRYGHDALASLGERLLFDRQIRLYPGTTSAGSMSTGRLPRLKHSDLYGLAQASIGQGRVLATPAHMALITGAIANGGMAMRPRLIADEPPEVLGQLLSADTSRALTRLMRRVITHGTGRGIETPGLAIAGKTGTAENPQGPAHSWFIGFAPAEDPELALAVLVEHGGYGSRAAAPIARDLLAAGIDPGGGP